MEKRERFDLNNLTIKEAMSPAEAYAKVRELREKGLADDIEEHPSIDECLMRSVRRGRPPAHIPSDLRKRYDELKKEYDKSMGASVDDKK